MKRYGEFPRHGVLAVGVLLRNSDRSISHWWPLHKPLNTFLRFRTTQTIPEGTSMFQEPLPFRNICQRTLVEWACAGLFGSIAAAAQPPRARPPLPHPKACVMQLTMDFSMAVQEMFLQSGLRWRSYTLPEILSCNRPKDLLMRPEQPLAKQLHVGVLWASGS